jgi:hypothetical protein
VEEMDSHSPADTVSFNGVSIAESSTPNTRSHYYPWLVFNEKQGLNEKGESNLMCSYCNLYGGFESVWKNYLWSLCTPDVLMNHERLISHQEAVKLFSADRNRTGMKMLVVESNIHAETLPPKSSKKKKDRHLSSSTTDSLSSVMSASSAHASSSSLPFTQVISETAGTLQSASTHVNRSGVSENVMQSVPIVHPVNINNAVLTPDSSMVTISSLVFPSSSASSMTKPEETKGMKVRKRRKSSTEAVSVDSSSSPSLAPRITRKSNSSIIFTSVLKKTWQDSDVDDDAETDSANGGKPLDEGSGSDESFHIGNKRRLSSSSSSLKPKKNMTVPTLSVTVPSMSHLASHLSSHLSDVSLAVQVIPGKTPLKDKIEALDRLDQQPAAVEILSLDEPILHLEITKEQPSRKKTSEVDIQVENREAMDVEQTLEKLSNSVSFSVVSSLSYRATGSEMIGKRIKRQFGRKVRVMYSCLSLSYFLSLGCFGNNCGLVSTDE